MHRTRLALTPFIGALALCAPLAMPAAAQENAEMRMEAIMLAIEAADSVEITVAATAENKIELEEKSLNDQFRRAMRAYVNARFDFKTGDFYPAGVLVLYDRPSRGAMAEASIGLSLPGGVKAESTDRVKVMDFGFKRAVRHVHVGSFDQLEEVYDMIAKGLREKGQEAGFPVVLQILDDPTQTPPEKVRTVINVPVS